MLNAWANEWLCCCKPTEGLYLCWQIWSLPKTFSILTKTKDFEEEIGKLSQELSEEAEQAAVILEKMILNRIKKRNKPVKLMRFNNMQHVKWIWRSWWRCWKTRNLQQWISHLQDEGSGIVAFIEAMVEVSNSPQHAEADQGDKFSSDVYTTHHALRHTQFSKLLIRATQGIGDQGSLSRINIKNS